MSVSGSVTVCPPATSANLGPGFDSLALALALRDHVTVDIIPTGVEITITGEGADDLPRDETHLTIRALRSTFHALGIQSPGLRISCHNQIPQGRGLGSSAAAICAGIVAACRLAEPKTDFSADDQFALAATIEGHADNVAACLFGGLTIAWSVNKTSKALQLTIDPIITPVVFLPPTSFPTSMARGLLPDSISHTDATFNTSRSSLLIAALTKSGLTSDHRAALLLEATEDRLHQPFRLPAMPESAALLNVLRADGVAALISGAGPTVLALACGRAAAVQLLRHTPPDWRSELLPATPNGVIDQASTALAETCAADTL